MVPSNLLYWDEIFFDQSGFIAYADNLDTFMNTGIRKTRDLHLVPLTCASICFKILRLDNEVTRIFQRQK